MGGSDGLAAPFSKRALMKNSAAIQQQTRGNWGQEMAEAFSIAEFAHAAAIYDRANDPSPDAQILRARIYLKREDPAAAIRLLDNIKEKGTETIACHRDMLLGAAYSRIGDFALADRHFERA